MADLMILYDNRATGDLRSGWGFSALLRTEAAVVMLDTGADKLVLEHNASSLGVNLDAVAVLVITHDHCDHMGAISSVLHKGMHLYVPKATARRFAQKRPSGIDVHVVKGPVDISPGVRSTGLMGRAIPEQALLVDGAGGPLLVTGCAHMGIARLVRRATQLAGEPLSLVVGGFHLLKQTAREIERTVSELQELGVKRIGASHCTGNDAMAALRNSYGESFVEIAVGARIEI